MRSGGETPMQTKRAVPERAQVRFDCACPYSARTLIESREVTFTKVPNDPVQTNENFRQAALAMARTIQPTPGSCRAPREPGETEVYTRCRVSHVSPAQAPAAKLPERTEALPVKLPVEYTAQWECADPRNPRRKGPCK